MKILQIVKGLDIGGHNGGAENFGIRLARALKDQGISVSLCAYVQHNTSVEKYWYDTLQRERVPVFFACPSGKVNIAEAWKNISNWLRKDKADIVHSHYQVGTITMTLMKIGRYNHRLIRTVHAGMEFGKTGIGWLSRLIIGEIIYPLLVDREIAVSKSISRRLDQRILAKLLKKRGIYIPNALPDHPENPHNDSTPDTFTKLNLEQFWLITTIGILVPGKNIDQLIRVMPEIVSQIPEARLAIVGDGPESYALSNLITRLELTNYCFMLGQQQDISTILSESNVFVLPSSSEGLSTVILEAMQHHVPVIASDIEGNREIIEHGVDGWLFPVGNLQELQKLLIYVHSHPEDSMRIGERGHRKIAAYSIKNITRQYIEVFSLLYSK